MVDINQTAVNYFILMGLTSDPYMKTPLFLFFLIVYLVTLVNNIGIIVICHIDPRLHTPMYFFLSNLSFVDLCYSSTVTPKMLLGLLEDNNVISISGCALQSCFVFTCGTAESIIISIMAFDRYTAICKPLHYSLIMTGPLSSGLAALAYTCGLVYGIVYTVLTFRRSFCGDNKIDHYFCDVAPLSKLSCKDTLVKEIIMYTAFVSIGCCNVIVLVMSYSHIIITVQRITSLSGRHKAFSTCSSHFACVVLFYSSALSMYLHLNSTPSDKENKVTSVFYIIIISMLNPMIYSLRNKDVKAAVWRIFNRRRLSNKE